MSDEVVITMTAQEAKAVAAWQAVTRAVKQNEDQLKKTGDAAKRAGDAADDAFGGLGGEISQWATGMAGFGSVLGGITTAYQLLRQEIEKTNAVEAKAAVAQIEAESARRRAVSLAGDLNKDDLTRALIENANGVDAKDMFLAFEAATSAAGAGVSRANVRDAVIESARLRPDLDMNARTALITGGLQLQKAFGGDIPTAMAAVQQSFGTSRAENLGAFSKAMVPTVADLSAQGGGKDSFRDLMGLVVGFGQRTNDPTGDRTRTALASLAKQAKETAITKGLVGKDASVLESIEAIRGNAKVQSELLGVFAQNTTGKSAAQLKRDMKKGTLTAEAAQFQAAVELFQGGDNATTKAIAGATQANMGMTPAALKEIEKTQLEADKSRFNLAARMDRVLQQKTAEDDLLVLGRAARQKAREFVQFSKDQFGSPDDIADGGPLGFVARKARETVDSFRGDEGYVAAQRQLLASRADQVRGLSDPAAKEFVSKLDEMVNLLDEAVKEIRDQKNVTQKVRIEADNRPQAPRRAPINGAGD